MADQYLRDRLGGLDAFTFDDKPWVTPPVLSEARVAVVTTAGLRSEGGGDWDPGDQGFTVLAGDRRDFQLAHFSPNFDRSGYVADINVVLPLDRLAEMAADGTIGSVASRHYSFMGAQPDHNLETIRLDTGPAVVQQMRDDDVDLVLLTPV